MLCQICDESFYENHSKIECQHELEHKNHAQILLKKIKSAIVVLVDCNLSCNGNIK